MLQIFFLIQEHLCLQVSKECCWMTTSIALKNQVKFINTLNFFLIKIPSNYCIVGVNDIYMGYHLETEGKQYGRFASFSNLVVQGTLNTKTIYFTKENKENIEKLFLYLVRQFIQNKTQRSWQLIQKPLQQSPNLSPFKGQTIKIQPNSGNPQGPQGKIMHAAHPHMGIKLSKSNYQDRAKLR